MSNYPSLAFIVSISISSMAIIGCQSTTAQTQSMNKASTVIEYNQWQWQTYKEHPEVVEALTELPSKKIQTTYDQMMIEELNHRYQHLMPTASNPTTSHPTSHDSSNN